MRQRRSSEGEMVAGTSRFRKAYLSVVNYNRNRVLLIAVFAVVSFGVYFFIYKSIFPLQYQTIVKNKSLKQSDSSRKLGCQNTVHGPTWITDSRGYVCRRLHVHPETGCCMTTSRAGQKSVLESKLNGEELENMNQTSPHKAVHVAESTEKSSSETDEASVFSGKDGTLKRVRFSCAGCDLDSKCCHFYEFCVSCCMKPSFRQFIHRLHRERGSGELVLRHSKTAFDFCRHVCRTSGRSVVHENMYVNANQKHCFSLADKLPEDKK